MRPLLLFVLVFLVLPAGATTYTVCSSGCDAVNLSEANTLTIDGDVIDILGAFQVENMNVISKNVTVEGNNHRITIAMPSYDSFGLYVSAQAVLNNISIEIVNTWAGAIKMENVTAKNWSNIHIEVNDSLDSRLPKGYPQSAGVWVVRSNYSKITNLTTKNITAPLWVRQTNNFTTAEIIATANRDFSISEDGAVYFDDSADNIISISEIHGYHNGIRIGGLIGGSITIHNITIMGTGKIHGNTYGIRGAVDNLTIIDVNLDSNTYDMSLWGMTTYNLSNITTSRMVLLPNGQQLNVTNYALDKITINGTEYDISAGYGLSATLSGSPPYRLELGYNMTRVAELDLNVSSLKVFHEITGNGNETLTPTEINTGKGTVKVQVNSLSPFYIFGERNVHTSTSAGSSSGSGGYYNPDFYNPDGTRRTTPTPTPAPTPVKPAVPEVPAPVTTAVQEGIQEPARAAATIAPAATDVKPVSSSTKSLWLAGLAVSGIAVIAYIILRKKQP